MPLIRGLERQTVEENKNADYMALPEQALVVVLMGVFALETSLRTEIGHQSEPLQARQSCSS